MTFMSSVLIKPVFNFLQEWHVGTRYWIEHKGI